MHVHVGAPKTGTTQVQDLLYANRDVLREHGLLVPGSHRYAPFHATVDLLDISWGGVLDEARGSFDAVMAEIAAWPGDVVLSNENLSLAVDKRVRRIRAALPDHDLRVVYSARDFVRQVPAAWQETDPARLHRRLRHVRAPAARGAGRDERPPVLALPDLAGRAGAVDPLPRGAAATLVTVPPAGTDPEVLLGRFLEAFERRPGVAARPARRPAQPRPRPGAERAAAHASRSSWSERGDRRRRTPRGAAGRDGRALVGPQPRHRPGRAAGARTAPGPTT